MTKANAGASEGGVPVRREEGMRLAIRQFFTEFDDRMPFTPENEGEVLAQFHLAGRYVGVINAEWILQAGRALLWFMRNVPHGERRDYLAEHFPDLPRSTAYNWMQEAKYWLQHGKRKSPRVGQIVGEIGPGASADGDVSDAPDESEFAEIADPDQPAPPSLKDALARLKRFERQLEALKDRDVQSQEALREKEDEIKRLKGGDSWEAERKRCPIRFLLAKAHLAITEANALIEQADDAELVRQADGDVGLLGGILSATQRDLEELIIQHKHRLGSSLKSHMDSD